MKIKLPPNPDYVKEEKVYNENYVSKLKDKIYFLAGTTILGWCCFFGLLVNNIID